MLTSIVYILFLNYNTRLLIEQGQRGIRFVAIEYRDFSFIYIFFFYIGDDDNGQREL